MAYPQDKGQPDKVHNTGEIIYVGNGTKFYPVKGYLDADGVHTRPYLAQREPFVFRPGSTALASGAVPAGTRSGATTTTSGTVANSTYWGGWVSYSPLRAGQIDGLATGGIIEGQITIGVKTSAGTGTAKLTAQIANTANTASPTTLLALTGTITCTTAEVFQSYDLPYLLTDSAFNAVPFSIRAGGDHQQGGSTVVFRIMESSFLQGEFEPGT